MKWIFFLRLSHVAIGEETHEACKSESHRQVFAYHMRIGGTHVYIVFCSVYLPKRQLSGTEILLVWYIKSIQSKLPELEMPVR